MHHQNKKAMNKTSEKKKFTFVNVTHFDSCFGCPFNSFYDGDNDYTHNRCDKLKTYVKIYAMSGDEDFRNEEGVLDGCPFLENNILAEEE